MKTLEILDGRKGIDSLLLLENQSIFIMWWFSQKSLKLKHGPKMKSYHVNDPLKQKII